MFIQSLENSILSEPDKFMIQLLFSHYNIKLTLTLIRYSARVICTAQRILTLEKIYLPPYFSLQFFFFPNKYKQYFFK